jgi:hypothetical protein
MNILDLIIITEPSGVIAHILTLNVLDEGFSRNAACALNYIPMFALK